MKLTATAAVVASLKSLIAAVRPEDNCWQQSQLHTAHYRPGLYNWLG